MQFSGKLSKIVCCPPPPPRAFGAKRGNPGSAPDVDNSNLVNEMGKLDIYSTVVEDISMNNDTLLNQ